MLAFIIRTRPDRGATFQHQHLEPFFSEFFRSPAAGDTGAHHDGIEFYLITHADLCLTSFESPSFELPSFRNVGPPRRRESRKCDPGLWIPHYAE